MKAGKRGGGKAGMECMRLYEAYSHRKKFIS